MAKISADEYFLCVGYEYLDVRSFGRVGHSNALHREALLQNGDAGSNLCLSF